MKRFLRKGFAFLAVLILCLNIRVLNTKAANVVIALSASTVSVGSNVTATITVSGSDISAYTIYVSYNSGVLQYNSASGAVVGGGGGTLTVSGTAAGSFSISFTAIANGSGSISTSGSDVYDINGNVLSISHAGATVTVATSSGGNSNDGNDNGSSNSTTAEDGETTESTEEDDRSSDCSLASLQVSPGTLSPAFSADRTSYSLQVDEDVTSVVVSAEPTDSKASTSISGANSIQKGTNTVKVTVTAENGAVRVYTITVQAGEDVGDPVTTIDGETYNFVMDEDNLEIPEGYTSGTTKYKDWEVLSFTSPNKKITVVCLQDSEGETGWYIMDADKDIFTPYQEYSSQYNRYIITAVPEGTEIPEGFTETAITIGDNEVTAYQSADIADGDLYLVYAINVEGDEGFYEYDAKEQAFLRYVPMIVTEEVSVTPTPTEATPTQTAPTVQSDSMFDHPAVIGILIAAGAVIALLIVCLVIVAGRVNKQHKELEKAEDMIGQLASANKNVNPELLETLGLDQTVEDAGQEKAKMPEDTSENSDTNEKPEDIPSASYEKEGQTAVPAASETAGDVPIIPAEIDALVEEVNRDYQAAMSTGEPYVEKSEKELAHEDYEKRSQEINNRIMTNYDSTKDSVFADAPDTAGAQDVPDSKKTSDSEESFDGSRK